MGSHIRVGCTLWDDGFIARGVKKRQRIRRSVGKRIETNAFEN
jgi:hypothetical protein